jgi:hypothetical protein
MTATIVKHRFGLLAAAICVAVLFWRPVPAAASHFNYDNPTDVLLSGSGITLTILPGSQADVLTVGPTSLMVALADGEIFMLRYSGPRPGKLVNNGGVTACNLVAGSNEIAMVGPTSAVVFTPIKDECTAAQSASGNSAAMALIQPNGGESWGPNTQKQIFWSSSGDVASVRLKLSVDGGSSYGSVIAAGLANTGIHDWTPPDWHTNRARVKVEALNASGTVIGEDASDDCFALTGSVIKDSGSCAVPDQPPTGNNPPAAEDNPPVTEDTPPAAGSDSPVPDAPPPADAPLPPSIPPAPGNNPGVPGSPPDAPAQPSVPGTETGSASVGDYSPAAATQAAPSIDADKAFAATVGGPALCSVGSLIKLADDHDPATSSDKAVYYCGADGKRHAFPNEKIFYSWFQDFSAVVVVSPSVMAAISLGANVTYRPGKNMVKLMSDPRVYVISRNGLLRWVSTEAIAVALYGSDWNRIIDDLPDSFFADYKIGEPIKSS